MLKWLGFTVGLLIAAAAALSLYGARRWGKATRALNARLEETRVRPQEATYRENELETLPPAVQRFFHAVMKPGQPVVTAANFAHTGTFNPSAIDERWKPFRSAQRVVTRRPGFVWDGRVSLLPGLAVHVHDAYIASEGFLHPAVMGIFPLANQRGRGELARGELMRFLAEAAWYPTALLPGQGVLWEAVDDRAARATLRDGAISVSLTFSFDERGLIDTVQADARGRMDGDRIEQLPWHGRFWNYAERGGMQVPLEGEVAWLTLEGRKPYWRGKLETVSYEFAS